MSNIVKNQIDGGCLSAEGATTKRHSIVARLWLKAYRWVKRWNERRKAANTLARLNGDQLKDIGLRRDDIKRDYSRPFWR
ncbi:DUF1127 domain-containing protein [Serratia fonticola]|uniref:DUF1127 domain-containing protein n=1 Tax=Serratia fonticola TaxID=47917 RepID=UPI003AAA3E1F